MFKMARVLGRLISVLIDKEIITKEESEFILDPLNDSYDEFEEDDE